MKNNADPEIVARLGAPLNDWWSRFGYEVANTGGSSWAAVKQVGNAEFIVVNDADDALIPVPDQYLAVEMYVADSGEFTDRFERFADIFAAERVLSHWADDLYQGRVVVGTPGTASNLLSNASDDETRILAESVKESVIADLDGGDVLLFKGYDEFNTWYETYVAYDKWDVDDDGSDISHALLPLVFDELQASARRETGFYRAAASALSDINVLKSKPSGPRFG